MPNIKVGDWILLSAEGHHDRLLDRKSCFIRKAARTRPAEQLIAANIDTAFIVCSLMMASTSIVCLLRDVMASHFHPLQEKRQHLFRSFVALGQKSPGKAFQV